MAGEANPGGRGRGSRFEGEEHARRRKISRQVKPWRRNTVGRPRWRSRLGKLRRKRLTKTDLRRGTGEASRGEGGAG